MTKVFNTYYPVEDPYSILDSAAAYDVVTKELISYHVTDDPDKVLRSLQDGTPMTKFGSHQDDFGPGLYCSLATQLWVGRAIHKWDFLKHLNQQQKGALCHTLAIVLTEKAPGYLTDNEVEYGLRQIENVLTGRYETAEMLIVLADQPYNIEFWKPEFLTTLGITPGRQPSIIEVRMRGAFVRVDSMKERHQVAEERIFDGAFEVQGWSAVAQLCIWCTEAITSFAGVQLPPAHGKFAQKGPGKCSRCGKTKSIKLHCPTEGMCRYVCQDCQGYLMTVFEDEP